MAGVFVTPEWVEDRRDDVVLADVRNEWAYRDGHVPGAVSIPFDAFRDPTEETEGYLPTADRFASLLGAAGIASTDRIVAYDDGFGVYASRFLVTAEVFGHDVDRLHLLDGDYTRWSRDRPVSTDSPSVEKTDYSCERSSNDPLISAEQLDTALETNAVIVDTRDPIEYDTVHVPGAVNFKWQELVDKAQRRLEPPERCRETLAEHGITLDKPVRLYCNTARRLSFVYAVLRELGHEDVAFYEGGIATWAKYGGTVETTT